MESALRRVVERAAQGHCAPSLSAWLPACAPALLSPDAAVVYECPCTAEDLDAMPRPALYYLASAGCAPATARRVQAVPGHAEIARVVAPGACPLPSKPLVGEVARRLGQWAATGTPPGAFTRAAHPVLGGSPEEALRRLPGAHSALVELAAHPDDDDRGTRASILVFGGPARMLETLGRTGVRALLGLRKTAGSIDKMPPSPAELVAAFSVPHAPPASLSVGARALAKHCTRASDGWWGDGLSGTEAAKNSRALSVLARIMRGAEWLNVHGLPHEQPIYEVRCAEGYGARWSPDPPYTFRGFLEPHTPDGHENGWRH
eukprot:m51a1_g9275 putative rna-binding asch domain protein (318) ;mRNA; r:101061-102159